MYPPLAGHKGSSCLAVLLGGGQLSGGDVSQLAGDQDVVLLQPGSQSGRHGHTWQGWCTAVDKDMTQGTS
jgi:hypothetical protein